jgi:hypothetical protein
MDFSNRTQSQAGAQPAASAAGTSRRTNNNNGRWGRIAVVAAVAAIVIILLGVIIVAARGGGPKESSYVDSTTANTSVSLVKLGCELHEPFDKMLINRDQVTFWENLQDGGQVAKAVSTFEKQNPNGQKCADQSSASSSNSSNSAQPANNGSGTPATTTKP